MHVCMCVCLLANCSHITNILLILMNHQNESFWWMTTMSTLTLRKYITHSDEWSERAYSYMIHIRIAPCSSRKNAASCVYARLYVCVSAGETLSDYFLTYVRHDWLIWLSHSCVHPVIWHMNESWHICEWVMAHLWMSYVTHMNESCRTYEWVMA